MLTKSCQKRGEKEEYLKAVNKFHQIQEKYFKALFAALT